MTAPDLGRVLGDVSALARRAGDLAMRSPDFPVYEAGNIMEALTGARLSWQRIGKLGPERAGAVHFAKSIVVLSSMLGVPHGLTISMAGVLDDLRAPERVRDPDGYDPAHPGLPALHAAVRERWRGHRICGDCAPSLARDEPYAPAQKRRASPVHGQ